MKAWRLMTLAACLALTGGCSMKPSLVGEWTGTSEAPIRNSQSLTKFNGDGSYTSVRTLGSGSSKVIVTDIGQWRVKDDSLTVTVMDVTLQVPGVPPDLAANMTKKFDADKGNVIARANKDATATLKWNGNDEVSLVSTKRTEVLRRKK